MKFYKYIILLLLVNIAIGCNDFLDEPTSKSTNIPVSSLEHLEALLNDYSQFNTEPNSTAIFGTDDFGFETDLFDASPGGSAYGITMAQYGLWDRENVQFDIRAYWPQEWKKIFTANLVLLNLPEVSGEDNAKKQIEAEAHFIRVYSYFQLANTYCLPYSDATGNELGLPIKQSTSFEENLERVTLAETWAFMEDDLQKALELSRNFEEVNGLNRSWRASTAAVNAFAARFYLALNDYLKAQEYAQTALNEFNILRDYNSEMSFSNQPAEVTLFNTDGTQEQFNIEFPYTHDTQNADIQLEWGESYYYRVLDNGHWKYWPSEELLGLYDKDYDLRYKYHIVEGFSYDQASAVDPPYDYPGYIFFHRSKILSGPSVSEMMLIKAECQARLGDFGSGINTVNMIRAMRIDNTAPASSINLAAGSQSDALVKILEERRREMPFVHRWYDIRRYNNNDDPSDDVVISRTFYPFNRNSILGADTPINFTLDKDSRKYATPIPDSDIISSNGVLQQNTY